jgi:AraC-like DNA-binding protein
MSRLEWLHAAVDRCQAFVGTATLSDQSHAVPELAESFVSGLPDVGVPADDLVLRSLLLKVATRWGEYLHAAAHQHSTGWRCPFDPSSALGPFIHDRAPDAKACFLEWAQTFSLALDRAHPGLAAHRVAAIIRARHGELSDAASLAGLMGISPRRLQKEFHRTFGMSLAKYVRQARLTRALEMMVEQPGKIEPIALQVGYASKKNFYKAFKQSLGMTPSAFLQLSPEVARQVVESAGLNVR